MRRSPAHRDTCARDRSRRGSCYGQILDARRIGYADKAQEPDLVVVEAGRPVRLLFNRQETAACSEMVLFPDFDISRELPAGETVSIELPAPPPGEYEFACQMGMLRGKLVATENGRETGVTP